MAVPRNKGLGVARWTLRRCGRIRLSSQRWKFYNGGEIQETYTAGSIIDIEIGITAHHNGHFEFFLCDSEELTLECLQKHQLQRAFPNRQKQEAPTIRRIQDATFSSRNAR